MSLFAIGDLHLSFSKNKPMDIFGDNWTDHHEKIKASWLSLVKEEDTVIITGDHSWGIDLKEAHSDLEWIQNLPGKKILIKGNHDYWWTSRSKMEEAFPELSFLYNNYYQYEEYAICGTRGWICPNLVCFTDQDMKIYKREAIRLENSIKMAVKDGYEKIIVAMHYPPTNDLYEPSLFTELFKKYGVDTVLYGHLHSEASFGAGIQGEHNEVSYHLTSCDYLGFEIKKIEL